MIEISIWSIDRGHIKSLLYIIHTEYIKIKQFRNQDKVLNLNKLLGHVDKKFISNTVQKMTDGHKCTITVDQNHRYSHVQGFWC